MVDGLPGPKSYRIADESRGPRLHMQLGIQLGVGV